MKDSKILMGVPVTVEIISQAQKEVEEMIHNVFSYFLDIDNRFSTYKEGSEISQINKGVIKKENYSSEMTEVLQLSEEWKSKTDGYFDIKTPHGLIDPSGLVKGWAIFNAAKLIDQKGFKNYFVSAGDDIQLKGKNKNNLPWSVGIRHPFEPGKVVKVLYLTGGGIATSGTYIRGHHIYRPVSVASGIKSHSQKDVKQLISLTIVGPDIYQADIYATACFAMGEKGLPFLENLKDFEGYAIFTDQTASWTQGFERYLS